MSSGQPGIWVSEGEAPQDPPVQKVFNRVGEIEAQVGDYEAAQVLLDRSGGGTVAGAVAQLRQTTTELQLAIASTNAVAYYPHSQTTPSNVWIIPHNLGRFPAVTVVDSAGNEIEGAVRHPTVNEVRIYFGGSCSGTAMCS